MKLVKYRIGAGQPLVGLLESERVVPLASPGGQYDTLTDILGADEPATTAVRSGAATPDLGGKLTTQQMGDRVVECLGE